MSKLRFILTGGPGAGKTSLLNEFSRLGYSCSEEASRMIIREQVLTGSDCLPWQNITCFSDLLFKRMAGFYEESSETEIVFFDRGIPDLVGFMKHLKIPLSQEIMDAVPTYRYAPLVFMLPPWKEIYVNDPERWQTFEESQAIHTALRETYSGYGFEIAEVPLTDVAGRAQYILSLISELTPIV